MAWRVFQMERFESNLRQVRNDYKCNLPQNRLLTRQFQFPNTIKQEGAPKIYFLNFYFMFKSEDKELECISLFMTNASLGCQKAWKRPTYTPVPVSPWDLYSAHSRKYHGESFFSRLL